jgi:hypothetical protein
MDTPQIACPKCGSTQLHADKKGFSGKKAVAGALLTGGIGLLAGTIGSNTVLVNCLACGHKWKPGRAASPKPAPPKISPKAKKALSVTMAVLFGIVAVGLLFAQIWVIGVIFGIIAFLFGSTAKM